MKQFNPDDELADIIQPATTKPTATATVQPATAPVSQPAQPASSPPPAPPPVKPAPASLVEDIEDTPPTTTQQKSGSGKPDELVGEEVEWGNEELMKRGDGLDRIRPEKRSNNVKRISLLKDLPFRGARRHFVVTKDGNKTNRICLGTKE